MHAYGGDRFRESGDQVVLYARLSKGWTAGSRVCPGSAVQWDDQYFEVAAAELLPAGGVRYVLVPWSDAKTMRTFTIYDEAFEERLRADYELAERQRRHSGIARISGVLLGHLPSHVQDHLANQLGLFPSRMTLLSIVPSMVFIGTCVYLYSGAQVAQVPSPVPGWVFALAALMLLDSAVRFYVAMSQMRGMGSLPGTVVYAIYRAFARTPAAKKLSSSFTIPPPDDVAFRDSLEMRDAFLTLLPRDEQLRIAERFGWDYRRYGQRVAVVILSCATVGILAMLRQLDDEGGLSPLVSLVLAAAIAVEQVVRLVAMRKAPAGSILGVFVRPFTRDLLDPSG